MTVVIARCQTNHGRHTENYSHRVAKDSDSKIQYILRIYSSSRYGECCLNQVLHHFPSVVPWMVQGLLYTLRFILACLPMVFRSVFRLRKETISMFSALFACTSWSLHCSAGPCANCRKINQMRLMERLDINGEQLEVLLNDVEQRALGVVRNRRAADKCSTASRVRQNMGCVQCLWVRGNCLEYKAT